MGISYRFEKIQRIFIIPTMPTIKVNEWTKERLDEIKAEEDHSSFDSVVKSLIKERQQNTGGENDD